MTEVGATMSKKGASATQVQNLQNTATNVGRVLHTKDAKVVADATNNNATLITHDKRLVNTLTFMDLKVKKL